MCDLNFNFSAAPGASMAECDVLTLTTMVNKPETCHRAQLHAMQCTTRYTSPVNSHSSTKLRTIQHSSNIILNWPDKTSLWCTLYRGTGH